MQFYLHKWLKIKKSLSRPCSRVSGKLCTKCCISYIKRTLDLTGLGLSKLYLEPTKFPKHGRTCKVPQIWTKHSDHTHTIYYVPKMVNIMWCHGFSANAINTYIYIYTCADWYTHIGNDLEIEYSKSNGPQIECSKTLTNRILCQNEKNTSFRARFIAIYSKSIDSTCWQMRKKMNLNVQHLMFSSHFHRYLQQIHRYQDLAKS